MTTVNHRTRGQEEQTLEECMGCQVIHGRSRHTEPNGHHHVGDFRQRGVGQNPFDVVLLTSDQRRKQGHESPDPSNRHHRYLAHFQNRKNSNQHVHTRYHHRGRVQKRGNWGWTFHRIGQPDMKWKLSRLSETTAEKS